MRTRAQGMYLYFYLTVIFIALLAPLNFAQISKMTMLEFDLMLQEWAGREEQAKLALTTLGTEIKSLRHETAKIEAADNQTWQEIYQLTGSDEAGVRSFLNELATLKSKIEQFKNTPDANKKALQMELNHKVAAAHKNKIGVLTEAHKTLGELEKRMILINLKMR